MQAESFPAHPGLCSIKAREASVKARRQRSDGIVDAIARVLLEDVAYRDLSNRALADLLNRRKILTGWQRPWTGDSLKRHRRMADERIEEWSRHASG